MRVRSVRREEGRGEVIAEAAEEVAPGDEGD